MGITGLSRCLLPFSHWEKVARSDGRGRENDLQEEGPVKLMVRCSLIRPPGTPYQVRGRLFSREEKEKR
jgi:hypothetical protein